jgi:hypothetical protein
VAEQDFNVGDVGAALADPQRAGMAAAFGDPGRDAFARDGGQGDVVDLVALAVQPDAAGAGGDRDVLEVEAFAFLDARVGVDRSSVIARLRVAEPRPATPAPR